VVRQYRFLLREAAPEAVEEAHIEAMTRLSPEQRLLILTSIQHGLLAGQRLSPEDISKMARLIVLGERRSPNAFISACDPVVLRALSDAVIHADASFGLFGQYATWDGVDRPPRTTRSGQVPGSTQTVVAGTLPAEPDGTTRASFTAPAVVGAEETEAELAESSTALRQSIARRVELTSSGWPGAPSAWIVDESAA